MMLHPCLHFPGGFDDNYDNDDNDDTSDRLGTIDLGNIDFGKPLVVQARYVKQLKI